ncbi:MAG: hypothetical protein COB54_08730 [Alphaproteobacteria bacterium]|nr:MAG: hypothetical protein COB54_08730 [Alphaproteobacteria bacterium]
MTLNDGILIDKFSIDNLPNDILKGIYQYWLDMKGDRIMPSRADLHPADIVRLLPNISLIDVEPKTHRYRMRLVGSETVRAMDKDITGKYLDELPEIERHLKERYDWIVRQKRPYYISDKLLWSKKSFLTYYSVGLPLSNDGQNVDIIMFGSYYHLAHEEQKEFPAASSGTT